MICADEIMNRKSLEGRMYHYARKMGEMGKDRNFHG